MTLVVLELVENTRMPVDDPTTHLELTMIHEVMCSTIRSGFRLYPIRRRAELWILGARLSAGCAAASGSLWLDGGATLLGMVGPSASSSAWSSRRWRATAYARTQFIVGAATLRSSRSSCCCRSDARALDTIHAIAW